MTSAKTLPSTRSPEGSFTVKIYVGRAWNRVAMARMDPQTEGHPAARTLHRLADIEEEAVEMSARNFRMASALEVAGTTLTLLALALAAIAGFGALSDLAGPQVAGTIALAAAVVSAVSAFVQTKAQASCPDLRREAWTWRHYADDVNDSVVFLLSRLPMKVEEFREQSEAALEQARLTTPSRTAERRTAYED